MEHAAAATVRYRVVVEPRGEGGFNVWIPELPEISASGATEEEALRAARVAISSAIIFDVQSHSDRAAQPVGPVQLNVNSGTIYRAREQLQARGMILAVLIVLATQPRGLSAEALCEQLYPNTPFDQAYSALKMSVYRTRQLVGQDIIERTQRGYQLASDVIVDIRFLPQIVRAIRERSVAEALEERLASIFEDLMEGRPAVFATWEWFASTERMLQGAAREIGLYIGERALRNEKALLALDVARRLSAADSLDEGACELVIRALLAMGNRASALLEYRAYCGRLEDRMGIEPSLAIRRLIEAVE